MRGLRAGQRHDDISWPGLVNQFIKLYLTDDVLGEAYDAVATARQQPHETENAYADRLESAAFRCTAVFTEQALAHYFVRRLAPATRTAVAETVQRLPGSQKTDLSSIRRIATAEGTTFRARRGLPLPDPNPAGRAGRPLRSNATSSPATALHIGEDEWQANPVLIARGMEQGGGRPPRPASTRTTRSFATAFAHTPHLASGTNHPVQELDISRQRGDRASASVHKLTEEETRHAASFASTDGNAYVCWLCRTYGHAMYACPFLTPEHQRFRAFKNFKYQMETRPGMRNSLQQSAREDRFSRQGYPSRSGGGARFAPREGGYCRSELDQRDRRGFR